MNLQSVDRASGETGADLPQAADPAAERKWFATFTLPQNEKSVLKQLDIRSVESFLPTYETVRVWKNRQRKKVTLPLFPTYVFVRINRAERGKVLRCPGVLHIVGNHREPLPLADAEVELLRSGVCRRRVEPYRDLVIGDRVRIKSGIMSGVQGTLVRRNSRLRFVLTIQMINQHAAIEVNAEDMEPVTG
ncbi:MAG: UpxY family transcription antiterminator [Terracidiphilus sp.]